MVIQAADLVSHCIFPDLGTWAQCFAINPALLPDHQAIITKASRPSWVVYPPGSGRALGNSGAQVYMPSVSLGRGEGGGKALAKLPDCDSQ